MSENEEGYSPQNLLEMIEKTKNKFGEIESIILCDIKDGKKDFCINGRHRLLIDSNWKKVHLGELTLPEALNLRAIITLVKQPDSEKNRECILEYCDYLKEQNCPKGQYVKKIYEGLDGAISKKTISKYVPDEYKIVTKPKGVKQELKEKSEELTTEELTKMAQEIADKIVGYESDDDDEKLLCENEDEEPSREEIVKDKRRKRQKADKIEIPKPTNSVKTEKPNVIYADPPWRYEFSKTNSDSIEAHYKTMSLEEIKAIEFPCDKDAILFLWTTNPKLNEALEVIESWGFKYRTNMVWVKDKFCTGYYVMGQHELLLIAKKGKMRCPEPSTRPSSVLNAPRRKHSQKPDEAYERIEKMYPDGTYLELFARNARKGWTIIEETPNKPYR